MFAVPGWSVGTSVAQEKPSAKSRSTSTPTSKKRKSTLPHAERAAKVSGDDLEKKWDGRVDLKPAQKPKQNHDKRELGAHGHQKPERRQNGRDASQDGKKPYDRPRDKRKSGEKPKALEGSSKPQRDHISRDRISRDKPTSLSNGDGEITSFPRDNILKTLPPVPAPAAKLTALQSKMRSKLTSARFRHLNETLYTTSSTAAMDLFTNSPDLFSEYHAGFSQQVKDSWPVNPVEKYVAAIKIRGAVPSPSDNDRRIKSYMPGGPPLPRRPKTSLCSIADLGCGDAPLARGCQSIIRSHKLKFHNFDLHAPNTQVTKADISKLPLRDGEVDIAVFCLSLMGTNWINFVEEAWRVLRGDGRGECWISEVKSRFGRVGRRQKGEAVENSVGKQRKPQRPSRNGDEASIGEEVFAEDVAETPGDETDISAFVKVFTRRGFQLREGSVDKSNKMFVSLIFTKSGIPTAGKHKGLKWTGREYQKIEQGNKSRVDDTEVTPEEEAKVLKPCVYKTR